MEEKGINKNSKTVNSVVNAILNVTSDEWPRIAISWLLRFFYKIGYIIGWTVLVAMFVTKYGIASLPYFFILYAVFRILSAFLYSNFINKFRKDLVIIFTVLIACLFLFIALLLSTLNTGWFILISIAVLGMFFSQLYIINTAFIEELFSPLESERTFPIIESAETIGGIIAGLLIAQFSFEMQPYILVYLLFASLLLILPVIISHRQILKKLPFIHFKRKRTLTKISVQQIKESINHMKQFPFLKVLLFVVLSQWLFTNLLEFQYTNAVYANVEGSKNIEHELTQGLGSLQILFHSFALLMQLFVASRIISSLGIMGSLLLHPVVTLFSLGTLLFRFGFASAVVTKVNFEMTNIIHINAYHTSYYAMEHKIREQMREILEGFIQPIGALIGMIVLLILENTLPETMLNSAITILMMVIMSFMFMILLKNESKYTHISIKNLTHSSNPILQLNAVEVLGQKGHSGVSEILTKTLKNEQIDDRVKIRILETLGHMKEQDSILEILDCLKSENPKVRSAALKSINKFEKLEKDTIKLPFSHFRINNVLKQVFADENDRDIKALIIRIIAKINKNEVVPFILDLLKTNDTRLIADTISVCGYFNDINIVHYLQNYLNSRDPKIRGNAISALWQFKHYRIKLLPILDGLLYSTNIKDRIAAYRVVGEINAIHQKNRLKAALESQFVAEKLEAAIALCKMKFYEGINTLVEGIMSENEKLKNRALNAVDSLPKQMKTVINNSVIRRVSSYINALLAETNKTSLEDLDTETLLKLRKAYELVNEHEEVQNIDEVISKNSQIINLLQFNPT